MLNESFEKDLQEYARTNDEKLFNEKLYQPLSQLFQWLCARQKTFLSDADFKDIQQQAMIRVVIWMKTFKTGKGRTAVSYARKMMQQELALRRKTLDKLSAIHCQYKEDMDVRSNEKPLKTVDLYEQELKDYRRTLAPQHRKIVTVIIRTLTDNEVKHMSYVQKLNHFTSQSKSSIYQVRQVLKDIRAMKFYE